MPAPVFVLGAPRSGTTLLRVMLAGHPALFSPPEMVIAPFATMAERKAKLAERFWEKGGLRRAIMELEGCEVGRAKEIEASLDERTVPEVYAWLQDRLGDRLLVDKCPHLSAEPAALVRLARWFPDAKWVWIVRHPGSVVRSIENMPMAEVMLQGYAPDARDIWYAGNRVIQRFLEGVPAERQALVKYEDIVSNARPTMERVAAMLGVAFDDKLLDPYEGDRMREGPSGARAVGDPNLAGRGKIEPELATKWLEGFDAASVSPETHGLARQFGYDLGALEAPPITKVTAAMNALWDAARDVEAKIRVPADLDAVEGRRWLLRLVSGSLDLFVESNDPDRPAFVHAEGPTRKTFADNPDADYWRAAIRTAGGRAYRVTGRVPAGTVYTGILLYGRGGRVGNRLRDVDFVRPDGTFDVVVGATDPGDGSAWLKADGDETAVMVRQYFTDRARQPPIALCIDPLFEVPPPAPLDAAALASGVDKARRNLEATFTRTVEAYKMASGMALNRFIPIGGEQLFPTPDNSYLVCWYRFGQDQTMLVRGKLPKARYVSFCLYDAWMESFDYTRHQVILNHDTLKLGPDGAYEIQLSHRDLGHPNRLETAGHLAGYLVMRALLPEGELPVPQIEVMYEKEWAARRGA